MARGLPERGLHRGQVCQAPTCTDGVKNGDETDVDCGGGACATCGTGSSCERARDCAAGRVRRAGSAQPATCTDGVKNGDGDGRGLRRPHLRRLRHGRVAAPGASDCVSGVLRRAGLPGADLHRRRRRTATRRTWTAAAAPARPAATARPAGSDGDCRSGVCERTGLPARELHGRGQERRGDGRGLRRSRLLAPATTGAAAPTRRTARAACAGRASARAAWATRSASRAACARTRSAFRTSCGPPCRAPSCRGPPCCAWPSARPWIPPPAAAARPGSAPGASSAPTTRRTPAAPTPTSPSSPWTRWRPRTSISPSPPSRSPSATR